MISFQRLKPAIGLRRYAVFSEVERLGVVEQIKHVRNPRSDRPATIKWAACTDTGERIAVCSTRQEAGEKLAAG